VDRIAGDKTPSIKGPARPRVCSTAFAHVPLCYGLGVHRQATTVEQFKRLIGGVLLVVLAACAEVPVAGGRWQQTVSLRDALPTAVAASPRSASIQTRPWRPEERAEFLVHVNVIGESAPGLLERAALAGPVPIYRIDRTSGQVHGLNSLAGAGEGSIWIYNSFPRTPESFSRQAIAHEIAHVADQDSRIARSKEFLAVVEPRIRAARERVRTAGYSNLRDALLARRDDLARDVGLPTLYSATAIQEAFAEYVGYAIIGSGFTPPADVAAVIDNVIRLRGMPADPTSIAVRRIHDSYASGLWVEAIKRADEALELDAKEPEALPYRGFSFVSRREFEKAKDDLTAALAQLPEFDGMRVQVLASRASAHFGLGQHAMSVRDSSTALDVNPFHVPALMWRSLAYAAQKDFARANTDISQAIERSPDTLVLYFFRAEMRADSGDVQGAIADMTTVVTRSPNNARAFLLRGRYWAKAKKPDEARSDLARAAQLDPALSSEVENVRRELDRAS